MTIAGFPALRVIRLGLLLALLWWRGCSMAYHQGWRDGFNDCAEIHARH